MKTSPLIGVTLDIEPGAPGAFSRWPWYALRRNYGDAIVRAGGLPVGLGHDPAQAEALVARLDGLVVTGGAFDLDPALFGENRHPKTTLKPGRSEAEMALLQAALKCDLPVLGICGGMQLMAVACGGSLIQHIPDARPDALLHEQPNPRDEAGHTVSVVAGSRLRAIAGRDELAVNSSHHQAVRDPGTLAICARAPDGIIEAVEKHGARFCIGVQWHPEFAIDPADDRIFAALIAAAQERR